MWNYYFVLNKIVIKSEVIHNKSIIKSEVNLK